MTQTNVCRSSSQCWIQSSTKWSHLCRTWRKRTLKTRCRSVLFTLFFLSVPRQMPWPHSFLILSLSFQRLVSIPDLLSAIKLLCMRFQRELVTVVDDLRLDTLLRMLKTPHFSTKMNSLKEVSAQTHLSCPKVQFSFGFFGFLFSSYMILSRLCLSGDKVDRGEHGVQDGQKRHWHRQAVGLAGGELGLINSAGG